jgi:hypothetical protein
LPGPPPYIPGGTDPYTPPQPNTPGGALIPDGDGYLELDDGIPLGRWEWNDDEGMWMFDEFPPLSSMPQTGDHSNPNFYLIPMVLSMLCIFVVIKAEYITHGRRKQIDK